MYYDGAAPTCEKETPEAALSCVEGHQFWIWNSATPIQCHYDNCGVSYAIYYEYSSLCATSPPAPIP